MRDKKNRENLHRTVFILLGASGAALLIWLYLIDWFDPVFADPNRGNFPTWMGTIFSSVALILTVWTVHQQVTDRAEEREKKRLEDAHDRRQRARRVGVTSSWEVGTKIPPGEGQTKVTADRPLLVILKNEHDDPLRYVRVEVRVPNGWELRKVTTPISEPQRIPGNASGEPVRFVLRDPDPPTVREERSPGRTDVTWWEGSTPDVFVTFMDARDVTWRLDPRTGHLEERDLPA